MYLMLAPIGLAQVRLLQVNIGMTTHANVRALAAKCLYKVVDGGRSLSDELPQAQNKAAIKDKGLLQELCYGVLRYLPELEYEVRTFISKPLKGKQRVCHFLMLVGVYQLKYLRIPDHAAVSETVAACKPLKSFHLKGLINGVLRSVQRASQKSASQNSAAPESITQAPDNKPAPVKYNHPSWFIDKVRSAYPEKWQQILAENQQKPPMWLRVNQRHQSVEQYLEKLAQAEIAVAQTDAQSGGILLTKAVDVELLPGFDLGHVSVQDGAAQQAGILLNPNNGDQVLDCCAAPGGKTCHLLELNPDIDMTALDVDQNRLDRVQENLTRLKLDAKLICADASQPENWAQAQSFDHILLDAPCSATGVIRRHPDIKWLRKAADIAELVELQQQILVKIWSLLKPGGTLLYATCSILPEENEQQIARFIDQNDDAKLISLSQYSADENALGWQILPNTQGMDGFYYAKLEKQPSA